MYRNIVSPILIDKYNRVKSRITQILWNHMNYAAFRVWYNHTYFRAVISILLKFQWQVTITEKDILHSNVIDEIETLCGSILIYTSNLCCKYLMAVLDIFFTSSFPSLSRFVTFWYHKYLHLWRYIGSCVKSNNKTIIFHFLWYDVFASYIK